jgi:hypothetical protein
MNIPSSEEQDRQNNFMEKLTKKFVERCEENNIDHDFAAYVMIATGYRLALGHNETDPLIVSQILSSAISTALEDVAAEREAQSEATRH